MPGFKVGMMGSRPSRLTLGTVAGEVVPLGPSCAADSSTGPFTAASALEMSPGVLDTGDIVE